MAGSMNKVLLIGRLGTDPEARTFQNGDTYEIGYRLNLTV